MDGSKTQRSILESAKRHFLESGFQGASLRKIVADAGFTLGAFYGYYDSKEELFTALVDEAAAAILGVLDKNAQAATTIPDEQKLERMSDVFFDGLPALLDVLFAHRDEVRLLLTCAEGTRYQRFLDDALELNRTFIGQAAGSNGDPMNPLALDLLNKSYFDLIGRAVLEGSSRKEAEAALCDIQRVFAEGVKHVIRTNQQGA